MFKIVRELKYVMSGITKSKILSFFGKKSLTKTSKYFEDFYH